MPRYEYKVVTAPRTPTKVRGIRGDEARFALTLEAAINAAAAEGWEFVRAETLPCEHRGWLRRRTDEAVASNCTSIVERGSSTFQEAAKLPRD